MSACGSLSGQGVLRPTAQLTDVRLVRSVSVQIRLFSAAKDLVVPYCGEGEGGTEALCNLPTHLEREVRQGWQRVGLRTKDAVLGGVPAEKWKFRIIPAGHWRDFSFWFPRDDFAIEQGPRLRVVVDAWPDEQSMRSGGPAIRLASSAFACP
jgi:hypothetical protein